MDALLPLPCVIPLLAGALVTAIGHFLPRRADDIVAIAATAASAVLSFLLLLQTESGERLHWFGGWHPKQGIALGIAFQGDPFSAGIATLVCLLATAALVYSWRYFDESGKLYVVLMLMFTGAMCGFALTADLFNMFVFFELMGVAAYALTGYKIDELGPLQGALNFAITNSIGAFLILMGIALLYARTGALNLAQIGHSLAQHRPDGLVVTAFTLLVVGLLVKAALVPFHFWLADAYAVAPAPVCLLLAGAMSKLGLYGIARVYWTMFAGTFSTHAHAVRDLLLAFGIATGLVGGVMAFLQRHLKRMLAYVVIAHGGIVLAGIALLDDKGLAGGAELVLADGLLLGALFLGVGILVRRTNTVDELDLRGQGREFPLRGALWIAASIGLTGLPFVGSFAGHALLDDAATERGLAWLPAILLVVTALSAAPLLRAAGRIFAGWGASRDPLLSHEPREREPEPTTTPLVLMLTTTAALVGAGLVISVVPGLERRTENAAHRFRDTQGYIQRVLHSQPLPPEPRPSLSVPAPTRASVLYGAGASVLAFALAALGLWRRRLPELWRRAAARLLGPPFHVLKELHSGAVGDYVAWLTLGAALIGGIWAGTLR